MDAFIEKIVQKRKEPTDMLALAGILLASATVGSLVMFIGMAYLGQLSVLLAAGSIFLGYRLATMFNIEFEYLVTNDSLDVDKITSQRKRKRIFSIDCKAIDAIAPANREPGAEADGALTKALADNPQIIRACSGMKARGLYYVLCSYKGKRTVLYFEPDQRMLASFRRYIPRKVTE